MANYIFVTHIHTHMENGKIFTRSEEKKIYDKYLDTRLLSDIKKLFILELILSQIVFFFLLHTHTYIYVYIYT